MIPSRWGAAAFTIFITLAIAINTVFFIVSEMEQVIITEFGQPVGEPITEAGLYTKLPWRTAIFFDKRILRWDGDPTEIPTRDKKRLLVDSTARWRIADPLLFLQSVRDQRGAQARLDAVIDSAVRENISRADVIEIVRSGNEILEVIRDERRVAQAALTRLGTAASGTAQTDPSAGDGSEEGGDDEILREVTDGRRKIQEAVLAQSRPIVRETYGIELIDVVIRRVNYTEEVRKNVFTRMISERTKVAERYRSEGKGRQARIRGDMEQKLRGIESGAYREAREIEGTADAEAARIYADAYNRDPEFYGFWKALETLPKAISDKTELMLTTDSELVKLLKSAK
jgi:modulator of FtsH protease HflC